MDYEKKYKEALERAKEKYTKCYSPTLLDYIFPELKEDDGEKSKKWILEYLYDGLRKSDEQFKGHFKTAIAWLEKQDNKSVNIDIDSMITSYKQRLKSQAGIRMENNPLVNMCLTAFRHGVENTLEELNLKKLEKEDEQETLCDKCRKAQPSHSCQDITALGRCSVEHEQDTDNSYCQENCKGFQETGKCFADGDCKAKREVKSTNKVKQRSINEIEIPFGAKDSELQEATYYIPDGFHAEIDGDFVIIKKGEPTTWNKEDEELVKWSINNLTELKDRFGEEYGKVGKCIDWLKSLKERIGG